jgi:hypothetical protein
LDEPGSSIPLDRPTGHFELVVEITIRRRGPFEIVVEGLLEHDPSITPWQLSVRGEALDREAVTVPAVPECFPVPHSGGSLTAFDGPGLTATWGVPYSSSRYSEPQLLAFWASGAGAAVVWPRRPDVSLPRGACLQRLVATASPPLVVAAIGRVELRDLWVSLEASER